MPSYPHLRPQPARPGRRRRRRRCRPWPTTWCDELTSGRPAVRLRGPGRAGELPAGADRVAGQPARLLGQGQRVLPAAPARRRLRRPRHRGPARCPAQRRGLARRGADRQARPAAVAGLPDDQHHAVLRRRAARRDLVREARPEHHRHAPVRALVQPGDRPAVADPHRLGRVQGIARGVQRARRDPSRARARTWSRRRCCTTPPTRLATPHGRVLDWKAGECEPVPGRDHAQAGRRRARLRRDRGEDGRARPAGRHARRHHQGRHLRARTRRSSTCGSKNGVVRGGRRRPAVARHATSRPARRSWRCPAPPTGAWPPRASAPWRSAPGMQLADLAAEHEGKQITFADTQAAAGAGDHLAGVVGHRSPAGAATRRSPSTSSASSPGTPSPAGSTSSSTTTGWPSSASSCRSTGRR